ncbi:MAG: hypothetical protein LC797_00035 [Chloroflexi bacterium]|nr:hypothetical protein [Chloroflexota bacterium]
MLSGKYVFRDTHFLVITPRASVRTYEQALEDFIGSATRRSAATRLTALQGASMP